MTIAGLICFHLSGLFIPLYSPWIRLELNPIQTSNPIRLERAYFESLALIVHPISYLNICLVPLLHVAVTIAGLIHFQLSELFIPLCSQFIRLEPDSIQTGNPIQPRSGLSVPSFRAVRGVFTQVPS